MNQDLRRAEMEKCVLVGVTCHRMNTFSSVRYNTPLHQDVWVTFDWDHMYPADKEKDHSTGSGNNGAPQ